VKSNYLEKQTGLGKLSIFIAASVMASLVAAQFTFLLPTKADAVTSWSGFNFGAAGDWAAGTQTQATANTMLSWHSAWAIMRIPPAQVL
jgi:hypothetical protein